MYKVAVLISTFNGEKYIDELLISLKNKESKNKIIFTRR